MAPSEAVTKHGIVDTPTDNSMAIEFRFDSPKTFKDIWTLFKKQFVDNVCFMFDEKQVTLCALGDRYTSEAKIVFEGKNAISYYCSEPYTIVVPQKQLFNLFKSIDKTYKDISIVVTYINKNCSMDVELTNISGKKFATIPAVMDSYNYRTDPDVARELAKSIDIPLDEIYDTYKHKLKFSFSGKFLKKSIPNNKQARGINIIQNSPTSSIIMEIVSDDDQIQETHSYITKTESVSFISNLRPGESFRTKYKIHQISTVADAFSGEIIELYIDERLPLVAHIEKKDGTSIYIVSGIILFIDRRLIGMDT
jgi:energy-converting hydrogenase A subunit M